MRVARERHDEAVRAIEAKTNARAMARKSLCRPSADRPGAKTGGSSVDQGERGVPAAICGAATQAQDVIAPPYSVERMPRVGPNDLFFLFCLLLFWSAS